MSDYKDVKIEPTEIKTEEIEIKEEPLDATALDTALAVKKEELTQEIDGNNNLEKPYQHHEKRSKNPHYKHQFKNKRSRILHQCEVCPYESQKKSNFLRHLAIHTDGNQYYQQQCYSYSVSLPWFRCYNCPYKTSDKNSLVKHVRLHKPSDQLPFTCTECRKKFNEKGSLNSHIVKKHYDNKTLRDTIKCRVHHCPQCKYKDVNKSKVTRHWASRHN